MRTSADPFSIQLFIYTNQYFVDITNGFFTYCWRCAIASWDFSVEANTIGFLAWQEGAKISVAAGKGVLLLDGFWCKWSLVVEKKLRRPDSMT